MIMHNLPAAVVDVIETSFIAEFATTSAAGVPIDTPTYCFASDDLAQIGVATGLSYPAKAERARRNPKVGLLLEAPDGGPVVSIRGRAAVRDADLRANAIRYLSETGFEAVASAAGVTWEEARKAVWYWTRIIVDVAPEQVMWWERADAMDAPPHLWTAAATSGLTSDPAPPGKASAPSDWAAKSWQEVAASALSRGAPGHLTLLDAGGWPLPIRVRRYDLKGEHFILDVPRGAPWQRAGKGTLTFQGVETFVGEVTSRGDVTELHVERALPQHPLVLDPGQVMKPDAEIRAKLLSRLEEETARRGQPIPIMPDAPPALTRLATARHSRAMSYRELS